jgi:Transposase and inactivated derivatives
MLYLAIDQHKAQLTINLRNEDGDIVQKDQISTDHAAINDFFTKLSKKARKHRGFMAIVEVCGFNDWLLEKLKKANCSEIVVIQPDHSSNKKTDKRDANALGELLWNNRKRLLGGKRPNGIHRIFPADPSDAQVRQLSNFRQHLVAQRTKIINKIKGIINKHNMAQDAPTELYHTQKFRKWMTDVSLPIVDRFEVNTHLESWKLLDKQILEVEGELVKRSETNPNLFRLTAIPGISAMGAITLLARIGDIKRFNNPNSLANYFGLTPGCHNTAGKQRLGGITKTGSPIARQVLNFAVIHVVRKDPEMKAWYKKIKSRSGSKTARVAVMRKLATIIWRMLRWEKPYQFRYDPPKSEAKPKTGVKSKGGFSRNGNKNQKGRKGSTPPKSVGKSKA